MSLLRWQRWKKLSVVTAIGLSMVGLLQQQIKNKRNEKGEEKLV